MMSHDDNGNGSNSLPNGSNGSPFNGHKVSRPFSEESFRRIRNKALEIFKEEFGLNEEDAGKLADKEIDVLKHEMNKLVPAI